MRILRGAGLLVLAAMAFWLGRGSAELSAQGLLPDGVFVRDSGGGVWLIIGGQRAQVPFMPASDEVIFAIGDSGQWVVQGEGGVLTLGGQPEYVMAAPVAMPIAAAPTATMTPTVVPEDPGPHVSLQVDDSRIQVGQTVNLTLIADDTSGIEWIQWEGTIDNDGDNDNKATGDAEMDAEHRFDCDGRTQCANVWQFSPKMPGRYVLRARGRDSNGNRSEWVKIDFRVTGNAATATPTKVPDAPAPTGSPTP
jgi:hypothetical protein